jgi:hypothetical protein
MARKQQDNAPAPAAQPAYKVVKREQDRWWEVRDPSCGGRVGRAAAPAPLLPEEMAATLEPRCILPF